MNCALMEGDDTSCLLGCSIQQLKASIPLAAKTSPESHHELFIDHKTNDLEAARVQGCLSSFCGEMLEEWIGELMEGHKDTMEFRIGQTARDALESGADFDVVFGRLIAALDGSPGNLVDQWLRMEASRNGP